MAQIEDALPIDLASAFEEARDKAVFVGDGVAPNVSGLLDVTGDEAVLTAPDDPAAEATYAAARAALVDGKYATSAGDIALVVGVHTNAYAAAFFQTCSGVAALDRLGGRVSAHIPAMDAKSKVQFAVASRAALRAIAPTWPAISLVIDRITGASKGEILLTGTSLWNFKVLDFEAYRLLKFKLS